MLIGNRASGHWKGKTAQRCVLSERSPREDRAGAEQKVREKWEDRETLEQEGNWVDQKKERMKCLDIEKSICHSISVSNFSKFTFLKKSQSNCLRVPAQAEWESLVVNWVVWVVLALSHAVTPGSHKWKLLSHTSKCALQNLNFHTVTANTDC